MSLNELYNKTSYNGWLETPAQAMSIGIVFPLLSLFFVAYLLNRVLKCSPGEGEQVKISEYIKEGAIAFMKKQYLIISFFILVGFILISMVLGAPVDPLAGHRMGTTDNAYWSMAFHFLVGAILSSLSGYVGLYVAIRANVRTCNACNAKERPLNKGLRIAFDSGCVMGLCVVCFVCFGQSVMFAIFEDPIALAGFGFGGSLVALFARVGGGIFTKAADVGSDLVGKVEAGIPEDDPRNAGVIADNVGDNVGDVAGLGADLFESYAGTIVAAIPLGFRAYGISGAALPIWLCAFGIIGSIVGTFFVNTDEGTNQKSLLMALRRGIFAACFCIILFNATVVYILFNGDYFVAGQLYVCTLFGLGAGVLVGLWTELTTSAAYAPTKTVVKSTLTGPATVIIQGFGLGMASNVVPVIILGFTILVCYLMQGAFGVSIASVGMLSTLGITLATDAYGPVADNAGGIAQMAKLSPEVRRRTDALDSLGNTTAATGKGFAISSALMTTLALILEFSENAPHSNPEIALIGPGADTTQVDWTDSKLILDLTDPYVLVGCFLGSMCPFIFSALTMFAVGHAAEKLITEIRRQFKEIKGLLDGEEGVVAEYAKCVEICTTAALHEMVFPALIAIGVPIIFGYLFGSKMLGGILVGTILSGFMLAVMMANSGGSWDNAKKYIEAGSLGKEHSNGSKEHEAAVIGDTVGDPFKDTAGPSLDILAKLMSMISLVMAGTLSPEFGKWGVGFTLLMLCILFALFMAFRRYRRKPVVSNFSKLEENGKKEMAESFAPKSGRIGQQPPGE